MMELKDTVTLMLSDKYEDRFIAEYCQLKIRYDKLNKLLDSWDYELSSIKTPRHIFVDQKWEMFEYLDTLEERAKLEGITLPEVGSIREVEKV